MAEIMASEALLERAYADEDCGCPVEEWLVEGIHLTLHSEADGSMEMFVDAGDWDFGLVLTATTMEAARLEAFAWVRALPTEEEFYARCVWLGHRERVAS